jgi:hypothetical protein
MKNRSIPDSERVACSAPNVVARLSPRTAPANCNQTATSRSFHPWNISSPCAAHPTLSIMLFLTAQHGPHSCYDFAGNLARSAG